ncbi:helix-turn-helix domain-containing protein [Nocardia sp. N2S4-5]|uniref:helix-turn-helix domain-containing protein n=1 Tax=Nocardia sp. N2S4-5 TaxID=3351565 RepID=UPI0037D4A04A
MAAAHSAIAAYLRERREAAALTRAELAQRAGLSAALIQKIEQGTRAPTSTALGAIFDVLRVPAQMRDHVLYLLRKDLTGTEPGCETPEPADLTFLHSLPYPACFQTIPGHELIAVNDAYRDVFPGLEPGSNIIMWMMLDPVARQVMPSWEREAGLMVYSFRVMAPGLVDPARIEEIVRVCRKAPEWERLWAAEVPPEDIPRAPVPLRSPGSETVRFMHVHLLKFELPRRPWWIYSLVPDE